MMMTPTMMLPSPMNRMIEPDHLFVFVGRAMGILLLLYVFPGFIRGGSVTHTFSLVQDSRLILKISLDRLVIWKAVKTSTPGS
jgi:hypothetical protein